MTMIRGRFERDDGGGGVRLPVPVRYIDWRGRGGIDSVNVFDDEYEGSYLARRLRRQLEEQARLERERVRRPAPESDVAIGVDVARFGTDSTVICVRNGLQVVEIQSFSREDTMSTAGRVVQAIRRWRPKWVFVDEIGIGAGVVDRLHELKRARGSSDQALGQATVKGVNVSSRARDHERYANLRAEMFDELRQRFEQGRIMIPDDRELIEQLASIEYGVTSSGQLQIESKESMSGRGLRSPDKADALALAFCVRRSEVKVWG